VEPKKYRLGLDVGTNSLGWCVLQLDKGGDPCGIVDAGVRIFSEGRDNKSLATLAATRRAARSARRRRDRFKQRRNFLLQELTDAGLFPEAGPDRKSLEKLNPLKLRADALTRRLELWEVGRALFHLNQRRGFKSNRRDQSEEARSGVVSSSARLLLEQMGLIDPPMPSEEYKNLSPAEKKRARKREARTQTQALDKLKSDKHMSYGAFLHQRQEDCKPTRARPGAAADGKLYDVYPTRELYEDEFNKIWQAQAEHHPGQMTKAARDRLHRAIFFQRPLKPQKRGKCTYMSVEDRTFRAMPSFQRFRIHQEVNSLEWRDSSRSHRVRDYPDARDAIVKLLEEVTAKNGQVLFRKMETLLKRLDLAEGAITFNFEGPKRKGLDGNLTSQFMQHEDRIGQDWHAWPLERQDEFIDVILNGTPQQQKRDRDWREGGRRQAPQDGAADDKEVQEHLIERFSLDPQTAENCLNAPLKDDTASISLKAASLMLERLRNGIANSETGEIELPLQNEAASAVAREVDGFADPHRNRGDDGKYELLPTLPYYGEAFRDGRHIIPGTGDPQDDDKTRWGGVTNPTVHIALNQIRLVVNELIERHGRPHSVAIELGRDLPLGPQKRRELERQQKEGQERNEEHNQKLRELGQAPSPANRLRLFLWEQLDKDPTGRCCPFSGRRIGIADLFSPEVEVEHLIPFSRSLDDSRANKVVCTREANRFKGYRTPHEAFGDSPEGYQWHEIFERSGNLPHSKQWRFKPDAMEIWQMGEDAEFTSRHLNDTRYIGRLTREYLECICHIDRIDVVTGRLTALLRRHWQLPRKNRDDHRHHAVDAIVVGMTNRSLLQRMATAAKRIEGMEGSLAESLGPVFSTRGSSGNAGAPWRGFEDDVRETVAGIAVSHKPKRKTLGGERAAGKDRTDGQLHKHTAYGIVRGPDDSGRCEVVRRKPVADIRNLSHVDSIRDSRLRKQFRAAFESTSESETERDAGAKAIQELAKSKRIRRLRCIERLKVIPIEDDSGKQYKAYKGDSNWGMEIYEYPAGHARAGKWQGQLISRFDANQREFKPGETFRPHPAARLVMRLQINDCVEMCHRRDGQGKNLYRLQKVSSGVLVFAEIHEANVARRDGSRTDPYSYTRISPGNLQSREARKVHISPSGRTSYENRSRRGTGRQTR